MFWGFLNRFWKIYRVFRENPDISASFDGYFVYQIHNFIHNDSINITMNIFSDVSSRSFVVLSVLAEFEGNFCTRKNMHATADRPKFGSIYIVVYL